MATGKREVIESLEKLPDDVTLEDIQYSIYVRQKVYAGLRAAEAGAVISQEEAERRLREWLENGV